MIVLPRNLACHRALARRPADAGCRWCTVSSELANRGFSLVELLLSLSLGLVLVAGLAQIFAGSRQTYASLQNRSALQESSRYALEFIGRSARNAGFLGCNSRAGRLVNTLNGNLGTLFELDIRRAVDAFDNDSGEPASAYAALAGIDANKVVPGTDIVTFRRIETPLHRVVAPVDPDGNPIVERRGAHALEADDVAVIADCEQLSLFRITGVVPGASRLILLRDGGTGARENSPGKPLSEPGKVYGPASDAGAAAVGRVVSETYYIADGRGVGREGESIRSLWRRTGAKAPAELVEGVADLQVSFAVDTQAEDGVAAANRRAGFHEIPGGGVIRAVHVRVAVGRPPDLRSAGQTFSVRNAGRPGDA